VFVFDTSTDTKYPILHFDTLSLILYKHTVLHGAVIDMLWKALLILEISEKYVNIIKVLVGSNVWRGRVIAWTFHRAAWRHWSSTCRSPVCVTAATVEHVRCRSFQLGLVCGPATVLLCRAVAVHNRRCRRSNSVLNVAILRSVRSCCFVPFFVYVVGHFTVYFVSPMMARRRNHTRLLSHRASLFLLRVYLRAFAILSVHTSQNAYVVFALKPLPSFLWISGTCRWLLIRIAMADRCCLRMTWLNPVVQVVFNMYSYLYGCLYYL